MKNLRIRKNLSEYIMKNKWQYFAACFSLILGLFVGAGTMFVMEIQNAEDIGTYIKNFVSAYNLQSVNKAEVFKFSVYNNIKILLFMWLSGLWLWLLPVSFIQLGAKGYSLGFSMTAFIRVFGGRGILFAIASMLSQLILFVPAIIVYCVFNTNFALTLKRLKGQRISAAVKTEKYIKNLFALLAMLAVLLINSLGDAYIMPVILKPLCSFMCR